MTSKSNKKRKKITDKQRLDWLQNNSIGVACWTPDASWNVGNSREYFPTLRQAIDAEMKGKP